MAAAEVLVVVGIRSRTNRKIERAEQQGVDGKMAALTIILWVGAEASCATAKGCRAGWFPAMRQ